MLIIITGSIGIGKTTVCRKVIELVRCHGHSCGGILSYTSSGENIILEDIQTGEKEILASTKRIYPGPHTPRYSFSLKGIDFGIRAIDKGVLTELLVVDELGHLELHGKGFVRALELIRADKVENCILVIRNGLLPIFLLRLPNKPLVFKVTESNRNQIPQEISSALLKKNKVATK